MSNYGASPEEWDRLLASGLAQWCYPVQSNPSIPISRFSSIKSPGKLPSIKNREGEIIGIPGWTSAAALENPEEMVNLWRRDPDAGYCVRTGHEGVIAIDADIDDPATADAVLSAFCSSTGIAPADLCYRHRGSSRWAVLCRILDGEAGGKRVITLDGGEDKVEILAQGQELVCAGTHPKGKRYQWTGKGLTCYLITSADLQSFCDTLAMLYGGTVTAGATKARMKGETYQTEDRLADWLRSSGLVLQTGRNGELFIKCPWCAEHTTESGIQETAYFPAGSNGYPTGGFRCLHAHCASRGLPEFSAWARSQGYSETSESDYPDESAPEESEEGETDLPAVGGTTEPTTGALLAAYTSEKTGFIECCISAVYIALKDPAYCRWEIAYDTFRGKPVCRVTGEQEWELLGDDTITRIRIQLEKLNFKTGKASRELVRDAASLIASEHPIDTMREYLDREIPEWDGVPRAETFFSTYCGAEDSEYTRAVGRYFWGMLWRRAYSPEPITADISLVLIGAQGANKTRLIQTLALSPEYHTELNFNLSPAELAMRMSGCVLTEFPEMVGFGLRKLNEIKAFLTLKADKYRPLYSNDQRTVTRRMLFVMTTNNTSFLTDNTGNRRYAPVEVQKFSADAVAPVVKQLWAEGAEIFKQYGGLKLHQDIEAITITHNDDYVLPDAWEPAIADWLKDQETLPPEQRTRCQTREIMKYALQVAEGAIRREDQDRVSDIMQKLGYRYKAARTPSGVVKMWVRSQK